jgi:uncharacterized repeat protein (TIGR01451 family)
MQRVAGIVAVMLFGILGSAAILSAQQPGVHYWHQGAMPPGAIGARQLTRGGPLPGYFQPVEIKAQSGALISLASDGRFDEPQGESCKAGMLIGAVYRLRITGIPMAAGSEVFPTVEIIDRTYPPVGMELRFPIPIELSREDIRLALDGKFVTKVIYLEDPRNALPVRENPRAQDWFEVRPGQDPLAVADALGRPVAILRMGGRLPENPQSPDSSFLFGCPPFMHYPSQAQKTAENEKPRILRLSKNNFGVSMQPPSPPAPLPQAGEGSNTWTTALSQKPKNPEVKILPPPSFGGAVLASAEIESPVKKSETQPDAPLARAAYPTWTPPGIRPPWPEDEYLRDGGDCGVPAGATGLSGIAGLQMEDTVAVYDTLDGRTLATPSNEVYIYSPRFAAVRQVVGLVVTEQKDRLSDVYLNTSLAAPKVIQKIGAAKQQIQLGNEIGARPVQAFVMKQGDGALSDAIGPRGFQNAFKPYENLSIIRRGVYKNSEKLLLARSHQAAVAWTHDQAVQVILDRRGAMAAAQYEQSESIFTVDLPPGNPKLRIVKTASAPDALPGEEVWFTIRFDNVGNQTIGNVVVIDSLSTRLEYVEGSAQCSREAKFSTQPNEGESLVVRCEIADPLEAGHGGVIRFCCKVR